MFYEQLEMISEMYSIIVMGISVLCVSIALQIQNKYGKDNKAKEKLEYYPPTEFNSAELGYIYKETDVSKSIVSLLIEFANEGYLRIIQKILKEMIYMNQMLTRKKESF